MNSSFKIGKCSIGENYPVFIIAELSCNHLQDFELAKKSILAMKECGADAVKLQTATPDTLTINSNKTDFMVSGGTLWDGKSLYELYKDVYTPWEWHDPIKKIVEELDMVFFSSPFDNSAVDFLEKLNVPAYKIASFELVDIPLIRYAASKGKPMIMSTGIAKVEDIDDAVQACLQEGNDQIILLKCTSAYPTPITEVNLNMITSLKEKYSCIVGISDHTLDSFVPAGAVALGVKVIEKHFIIDRSLGGPDAAFSLEPSEFKAMVDSVRKMELALGNPEILLSEKVEKSRNFARSLYVVEDIKRGEKFTLNNIRSIRPGYGMKPKFLSEILGKIAVKDIERGTPLSSDLIN